MSCHGAQATADSTNPFLTSSRWAQQRQKPSPTNPASFSQIAAAKPTETVVLWHWHSFIHISDFARIISLARRGRLFLYAPYTTYILWQNHQKPLHCLPSHKGDGAYKLSGRVKNEIELHIFLHKNTAWNNCILVFQALYFCGNREWKREVSSFQTLFFFFH